MNNDSSNKSRHEIIMCMGSACFTRGNNRSVEIVKEYLQKNNIEAEITFKGCLCTNRCKAAPVIVIDQRPFERVAPQSVIEVIEHILKDGGGSNEPA